MHDFIENPRREPRALARCRAAVVSAAGRFEAETEDVGAAGCRLSSPRFVHRGEPIQLQLSHDHLSDGLGVAASVAWTTEVSPWRLGIAFDPAARRATRRWFNQLLASVPGLAALRRVPARIPTSSMVYLRAPPRLVVDLSADELDLVRAIGIGVTAAALRQEFDSRWPAMQCALFSLLAHQHVTLQRGASVHPAAWSGVLRAAAPARSVPAAQAAPDFHPPMVEPDAWERTGRVRGARRDAFAMGGRSAEAEALYARALEKLSRGQVAGARVLLQQAARVAPGDAGIEAALVRAAGKA